MMGSMSGKVIGSDLDILDTLEIIAYELGSGAVTDLSDVTVLFLGDELDDNTSGRDNLPPAISLPESFDSAEQKDNTLTAVGMAIIVGLTLAFIGVILVIVRRRRRGLKLNAHQSLEDDGNSVDDIQHVAKGLRDLDGDIAANEKRDILPNELTPTDPRHTCCSGYQFDIGDWMKSELIGVHGENAIKTSTSKGEQGEYDSDNDSWAQTDATLGSLELRLDPIEAEV